MPASACRCRSKPTSRKIAAIVCEMAAWTLNDGAVEEPTMNGGSRPRFARRICSIMLPVFVEAFFRPPSLKGYYKEVIAPDAVLMQTAQEVVKQIVGVERASKAFVPAHFDDEMRGLADATGFNATKIRVSAWLEHRRCVFIFC